MEKNKAPAVYVKGSNLSKLSGKTVKVNAVYFPYFSGDEHNWLKGADGKLINKPNVRNFIKFPSRITQDVISDYKEEYKRIGDEPMELREKIYDSSLGKFTFVKYTEKVTREFYKTYKKSFDLCVDIDSPIEVTRWDKDAKQDVTEKVANNVVFQGVSASKIKTMLEFLGLDETIQLVEGKDKLGNPSMVKPFDWEDTTKDALAGKYVKVKVTGSGIDSKYIFTEGKEFAPVKDEVVDTPFNEDFGPNDVFA